MFNGILLIISVSERSALKFDIATTVTLYYTQLYAIKSYHAEEAYKIIAILA